MTEEDRKYLLSLGFNPDMAQESQSASPQSDDEYLRSLGFDPSQATKVEQQQQSNNELPSNVVNPPGDNGSMWGALGATAASAARNFIPTFSATAMASGVDAAFMLPGGGPAGFIAKKALGPTIAKKVGEVVMPLARKTIGRNMFTRLATGIPVGITTAAGIRNLQDKAISTMFPGYIDATQRLEEKYPVATALGYAGANLGPFRPQSLADLKAVYGLIKDSARGNFGKNIILSPAAKNIAANMAISAPMAPGIDIASQGINILRGKQDSFEPHWKQWALEAPLDAIISKPRANIVNKAIGLMPQLEAPTRLGTKEQRRVAKLTEQEIADLNEQAARTPPPLPPEAQQIMPYRPPDPLAKVVSHEKIPLSLAELMQDPQWHLDKSPLEIPADIGKPRELPKEVSGKLDVATLADEQAALEVATARQRRITDNIEMLREEAAAGRISEEQSAMLKEGAKQAIQSEEEKLTAIRESVTNKGQLEKFIKEREAALTQLKEDIDNRWLGELKPTIEEQAIKEQGALESIAKAPDREVDKFAKPARPTEAIPQTETKFVPTPQEKTVIPPTIEREAITGTTKTRAKKEAPISPETKETVIGNREGVKFKKKYQEEDAAGTLPREERPMVQAWYDFNQELAARRGQTLKAVPDIPGAAPGKVRKGASAGGKATVSEKAATLDTPAHEFQHGRELETGFDSAEQSLRATIKEQVAQLPEYQKWKANRGSQSADVDEFLATITGRATVERIMKGSKTPIRTLFEDRAAFKRIRQGKGTMADVERAMSAKMLYDAPYVKQEGNAAQQAGKAAATTNENKPLEPGEVIKFQEETPSTKDPRFEEMRKAVDEAQPAKPELKQTELPLTGDAAKFAEMRRVTEGQTGETKYQEESANPNRKGVYANISRGTVANEAHQNIRASSVTHPLLFSVIDRLRRDYPILGDAAEAGYNALREFRGRFAQANFHDILEAAEIKMTKPGEYWKLNNESLQKVLKYYHEMYDYGKSSVVLGGKEKRIKSVVDKAMRDVRTEHQNRPGLRKVEGFNPNYFPITTSQKVIKDLRDGGARGRILKKDFIDYRTKLKKQTKEEALKDLKDFLNAIVDVKMSKAEHFGPIDKAEGLGIPPSWRNDNLIDSFNHYMERVSRRLAYHDHLDPKMHKDIAKLVEDPLEFAKSNKQWDVVMRDIGQSNPATDHVLNNIVGFMRAGYLGVPAGARDIVTNPFHAALYYRNPLRVGLDLASATLEYKKYLKESIKKGVTPMNMHALEVSNGIDTLSTLRRARDVISDVQARNWMEKLVRATTFGAGKINVERELLRLQSGKLPDKHSKYFFDRFAKGMDWKKGKLTPAQIDEVAARFVESVQATYDARGLPAWALDNTKAMNQFAPLLRWSVEKSNLFIRDVIVPAQEGNYAPLLKALFGTVLGGAAVEATVSAMYGSKSKLPTTEEIEDAYKTKGKIGPGIYKLIGLAALSGYGGIVTDLAKSITDFAYGPNTPTGVSLLWYEYVKENLNKFGSLVSALGEAKTFGEAGDMILEYGQDFFTDNFQTVRLLKDRIEPQEVEDRNRRRDLRMFNYLQDAGSDRKTIMDNPDRYKDLKLKEFRDERDPLKAFNEKFWPAYNEQLGKVEDPIDYMRMKSKMQQADYNTMPNPRRFGNRIPNPEFQSYYDWLIRTQGQKKADEILTDYLKMKALQDAKNSVFSSPSR